MIRRIEATRNRSFDKLDVEVGKIGILVGAIGSGKTTLLVPVVVCSEVAKKVATQNYVDPVLQRVRDAPRTRFPAESV